MHSADTDSLDLRSLPPGAELHLLVREGGELFCRRGQLEIAIPQQAWEEGMPGLVLTLLPGQGWRAGADLRIRARARTQAVADLELHQAPMEQGRMASEEGMRPQAWSLAGWLRGFRRGQRAA